MEELGLHTKGKKEYKVYRADDGYLHLYRTTRHDKIDGLATDMDRIVTRCREISELKAYLRKKRKRRTKQNVIQLTIE